jgi:carbamoyltransferase
MFFGYGENGTIHRIKELYDPDSLGWFYGALTEYLGFEIQDGEYKVMGMAPYGDAGRYDFSRLVRRDEDGIRVNTQLINVIGRRQYRANGRTYDFSREFVDWLGPVRSGDDIDEPYIHYAATAQRLLEDTALELIDRYVGDIIRETGRLCFAGGVALNVKLNQRLLEWPDVKELFVQPAAGDAGTSLGAASYVATSLGERVRKLEHVYLGPSFSTDECIAACREPSAAAVLGASRRCALARGRDPRRGATARVVPGPNGVWTARARQPQHSRQSEPSGHGRAHQCANQVPRALAAVLPEHARHRRARHPAVGSSGAIHDDRLRRRT